jgi:transposase
MPRTLPNEQDWIQKAFNHVKTAKDIYELRMGLSILLLNHLELDLKEAGAVMGKASATVSRYRRDFFALDGGQTLPRAKWGGRRRGNLSPEQEAQLLLDFTKEAESGTLVTASLIHAKYEKLIKREIPLSTVTRMLDRHGWRKVEPEPHHPRRDEEREEVFKKKTFRAPSRKPVARWEPPRS